MITIRRGVGGILRFRMVDSAGDAVTGLVDGDFTQRRYVTETDAWGDLSDTITEGEAGWYSIPVTAGEADAVGQAVAWFSDGANEAHVTFMIEQIPLEDLMIVRTDVEIDAGTGTTASFTLAADAGNYEDGYWLGVWLFRVGSPEAPRQINYYDDVTGEYGVTPSYENALPDGTKFHFVRLHNDIVQQDGAAGFTAGEAASNASNSVDALNTSMTVLRQLAAVENATEYAVDVGGTDSFTLDPATYGAPGPGAIEGYLVVFSSAAIQAVSVVTAYDWATKTVTVSPPLSSACANGDRLFFKVPTATPLDHPSAIDLDGDLYSHAAALTQLEVRIASAISAAGDASNSAGSVGSGLFVDSAVSITTSGTPTTTTFEIDAWIGNVAKEVELPGGLVMSDGGAFLPRVIQSFDSTTGVAVIAPPWPSAPSPSFSCRIMRPQVSILDHPDGIEPGVSHRIAQRRLLAEAVGESQESGGTVTVRDVNNTRDAFTADVDASGNRSNFTFADGV